MKINMILKVHLVDPIPQGKLAMIVNSRFPTLRATVSVMINAPVYLSPVGRDIDHVTLQQGNDCLRPGLGDSTPQFLCHFSIVT